MSDRWTDLISEYLDEGLEKAERRSVETHVAECAECSAVLEDLRLVRSRARALPNVAATADLWPGIQARILGAGRAERPIAAERRRSRWAARQFSFSLPQLAAACVALAVLSGGAVWYAMQHAPSRVPGSLTSGAESLGTLNASANAPDHVAIRDVEDLGRVLAAGREKLDPATVRSLEESLMIIDLAIRQAKRALDTDPHNPYVRAHLDDTMRRKVEFLRRATILASTSE
jgi:anti-sigma factor RsiW